jgi:hypothetical protein
VKHDKLRNACKAPAPYFWRDWLYKKLFRGDTCRARFRAALAKESEHASQAIVRRRGSAGASVCVLYGCGFISTGTRLALTKRDQCVAALARDNADIKL